MMPLAPGVPVQAGTLATVSAGGVVLVAIAIAAIVAALAWRASRTYSVRSRIRQAISDPDPSLRRTGVELAIDRGLAASADMLLGVARDETDPTVLAALVHGIAQRQWEPASTPRIVELRLWAKAYVDAHEELRTGYERDVAAAARRPSPAAPVLGVPAVPVLPAAPESGATGTSAAAQGEPTLAGRPARRSSDATVEDLRALTGGTTSAATAPSEGVRVLVTGAGGPAGIAVVRDLVRHGHDVVAVDADPLAAGLRLASVGRVVPRFDDPAYADALVAIAEDTGAQALVCTVAEEYTALAGIADLLEKAGVRTLFPSRESVDTCIDKWRFAEFCTSHALPAPATALGSADGVAGPPWVVKPRFGRGSRDVHVAATAAQLKHALTATPDPIVQSALHGEEFTADALVGADGEVLGVVPRWRLETKAGISTKGRTFADPNVDDAVRRVLGALGAAGLVGPANVQGFVAADGSVSVHEVNPRFSGALPLSIHAGADLVEEYLRMVLGRSPRPERLRFRPDVVMLRHFDEVFEG